MPEVEKSVDSRCELPTAVPTASSRRWGGLCQKRLFAQMAQIATVGKSCGSSGSNERQDVEDAEDMKSQIRR